MLIWSSPVIRSNILDNEKRATKGGNERTDYCNLKEMLIHNSYKSNTSKSGEYTTQSD